VHPQRVLLAGRLDDPGQHQIPEHLVTTDRTVKPEQVIDPAQSVPPRPAREPTISNGPPVISVESRPRSNAPRPSASRCRAAALSASNSDSSWAEPRCSMRREPRRDDHTIRTAIAPDLVFTVRT
jgi:hypothetical protein